MQTSSVITPLGVVSSHEGTAQPEEGSDVRVIAWLCHVSFLFGFACVGCLLADDLSRCVRAAVAVADLSTAHTGHSTCIYCLHVQDTVGNNTCGILLVHSWYSVRIVERHIS